MAGLTGRVSTIVKAKISKVLDRAEDPAETLDYSYSKQPSSPIMTLSPPSSVNSCCDWPACCGGCAARRPCRPAYLKFKLNICAIVVKGGS